MIEIDVGIAAKLSAKAEIIGLLNSDGKMRNKVYMINCNREEGM